MNAAARPKLAAQRREVVGKKVALLRRAGRLPAVVYGHGVASSNVSIDAHEWELFRKHAGANTLVDLMVDQTKATPVLVHGVQVHPVSRRPLHIDLLAVRMTEELTVDVPIVTTGSTTLIERENGTLSHVDSVRIRALPDHLPNSIEISIDGLLSFDDVIHARDLAIPADAHLLTDGDEVVVRILPPRVEVEEPTAAEGTPAEGTGAEGAASEGAAEG